MACRNPRAVYACLNLAGADCPDAIRMRSILVVSDIGQALHSLARYLLEKETITGEEFMKILNLEKAQTGYNLSN